ncbi:unnamed protein product [Malus baccata var. baccata]
MEQFRRLTRELRETKKIAEEALKKTEAKNAVEDATGTKRQRAEEEDKGGSSSSAPYRIQAQTLAELALEAARGIRKLPFTEDILKAKKPAKFTQPKFRLFECATDPIEHIYHFQQQMAIEGDDEAFLCKLFPSSLSGSSLTWFRQLKPRSIGSFTELCEAFISQYVCNRRPRKDITILFSTKQNVGESLKSYMTRSMIETPPLNMREVMVRDDGIIRLEEEELIQSKQATVTIAASPAGTTTKDLSAY